MEHKDGSFTLFQKEGKYGKYYTGKAEINGNLYWVNINKNGRAKDGTPFLSGNLKVRQPKDQEKPQEVPEAGTNPIYDEWMKDA